MLRGPPNTGHERGFIASSSRGVRAGKGSSRGRQKSVRLAPREVDGSRNCERSALVHRLHVLARRVEIV